MSVFYSISRDLNLPWESPILQTARIGSDVHPDEFSASQSSLLHCSTKKVLSSLDFDGFLAVLTPLIDHATLDQRLDHTGARFVKDSHDVTNRQLVICEEIADGGLAFRRRVQLRSVSRNDESLGS